MITAEQATEKVRSAKAKRIKIYPQHVVRASEIGHPCLKYLVLSISNWEDRTPHDAGLEFVFEGGNMIENMAIKDLEEAGFKVYRPEPDKTLKEMKPVITGHLDVRVDFGDGKPITGEIKGLNKYDWDKLNKIEDFFASKKTWIKKYPAQLMIYMYMKAEEDGFFYLKSVPGFQPKFIFIKLDYEYVESLLKKTELIEQHVKEGTKPEGINDIDVCQYCAFKHICLPELKRSSLDLVTDPELEDNLEKWNKLRGSYKEYNQLDKTIKKAINGKEKLVVGDFLIQGVLVERQAKQQVAKFIEASSYWKYKIAKF